MAALLNPAIPIRRRIRWALVVHVVALFSFSTISLGIYFDRLSIEYVNNREFHSNNEFPPGPIGYGNLLAPKAATTVLNAMFPLKQWLADGLLVSPILNSSLRWVMKTIHPATSLLHHLFHEPLGHGLPIHDVPRFCWYVLKSSPNWR